MRYLVNGEAVSGASVPHTLDRTDDLLRAIDTATTIAKQIISPATFDRLYILDNLTGHAMAFVIDGRVIPNPCFPY